MIPNDQRGQADLPRARRFDSIGASFSTLLAPSLALLALGSFAGGCGDSGLGATTGNIVGTWERRNTDGSLRDKYVFKTDGVMTFDEYKAVRAQEDHVTGHFGVSGNMLNGEGTNTKNGQSARVSATYYASTSRLCMGAYYRQGTFSGVVGTWLAKQTTTLSDGTYTQVDARLEIRADGTLTSTLTGGLNQSNEGRWTDQGNGHYKATFGSGSITISLDVVVVDDSAVCLTVYNRAS